MSNNNYMGKIDEDATGTTTPNYDSPQPLPSKGERCQHNITLGYGNCPLCEPQPSKGKIEEHNLCGDLVATSSLMRFLDSLKKGKI